MEEHAVVVAGGGPTGLMLAAELALAGVDVVVVERRPNQDVDGSRSKGLHARSIEVLDQRGVADRVLNAGYTVPALMFSGAMLDMSDFPSRHNCVLALSQRDFEPILAKWVEELGVPIRYGREVAGFVQDEGGVEIRTSDGESVRASYLVGCDGGRSLVRKTAGIDFVGTDPSTSWIVAEVEMDDEPETGMRYDSLGTHGMNRLPDGVTVGVVVSERELRLGDCTIEELRDALVAVYGTHFGLRSAHWMSRFTDMTRQAVAYRQGRVLLAGDAAHVHPPQGGQGLNIGLQDAVNLGWKLGQVLRGTSPDSLLDTYHQERHPVGARVLHNTLAQVALSKSDDRGRALRETVADLLKLDEARRSIVGMISGLDVRYDLGDGHPLVGRRMPDLDLQTEAGGVTVYSLLRDARPVLLDLGSTPVVTDQVRVVQARYDGGLVLPVIGEVDVPSAVLIRPDGYVAWAGDPSDPQLDAALDKWCQLTPPG